MEAHIGGVVMKQVDKYTHETVWRNIWWGENFLDGGESKMKSESQFYDFISTHLGDYGGLDQRQESERKIFVESRAEIPVYESCVQR